MAINRTLRMLVLAAACLPMEAQQAKPSPAPAGSLDKAEALMQAQQFAQAEEKLQSLAATHGNSAQVWFDLGYCQSHLGKSSEASAAYRKAAELAPNWFEAQLNLGIALAKAGDREGAIQSLQRATGLKPVSGGQQALSKAWASLAQVLEESDPKAAAAAYEKAAMLDPGNPDLLLGAGRMFRKSGDLKAAEEHFLKSASAGNAQGMALLIDLLAQQKRYPEAENWLRKYAAQNPQDAHAQEQLGKLLAAEGKSQEATAVLEQISKNTPDDPAPKRELAELYLETKQYQQAEPLFRQLLSNNASDPELHRSLGVALLYQLKYGDAEQELILAVKLKPDDGDAYGYLAEAARENKHYELTIRALDARAKFLPESAKTYFIRATSYDHLKMPKQAAQNYKQFLAVAGGKYPDQEFQARHRLKAIEPE